MTRKDFELIASVLREASAHNAADASFREGWHAALSTVAVRISRQCAHENPRFDERRFLDACDPTQ